MGVFLALTMATLFVVSSFAKPSYSQPNVFAKLNQLDTEVYESGMYTDIDETGIITECWLASAVVASYDGSYYGFYMEMEGSAGQLIRVGVYCYANRYYGILHEWVFAYAVGEYGDDYDEVKIADLGGYNGVIGLGGVVDDEGLIECYYNVGSGWQGFSLYLYTGTWTGSYIISRCFLEDEWIDPPGTALFVTYDNYYLDPDYNWQTLTFDGEWSPNPIPDSDIDSNGYNWLLSVYN